MITNDLQRNIEKRRGIRFGFLTTLGILALLLVSCGGSNDGKATEESVDLTKLLPAEGAIAGYSAVDTNAICDRNSIWDYIGPNADVYLYNGFKHLLAQEYKATDGSGDLMLEIFEFSSPRSSFALYSNMRSVDVEPEPVGAEGIFRGDTLLFLKSNYLVKLYASSADARPALLAGAKAVAEKISGNEPLPSELKLFPTENLIPRSIQLTLNEFLGQTALTDVFSGKYAAGSDTITFSFRLGSENEISNVVKDYIGSNGSITGLDIEGVNQVLIGETPEFGKLYTTVREGALCFVTGFSEKKDAQQLVSEFYRNLKSYKQPATGGA